MENIRHNTIKLTTYAMMLALIMVFSLLEATLAPLLALPPGVKIGLSNIVVMYGLFFMNKQSATLLVVLKSVFVLITRGPTSGLLSFSGGIFALLVMILLMLVFKGRISIILLSITGAISHNIAQLIIISFLFNRNLLFVYLPILLISGIIMGLITSNLLRVLLPLLKTLKR